jgi:excisionase family DNA binding protein
LGESRWDIDAATTVGLKFSGEASGTASGKLSDDETLQVAAHRLSTERIVLMKTVFTTGEAAKICKVSQQTIIRCFDSGQLKGFRVPGSRFRRIPRDVLYKFMKENGIPTDALESGKRKALIVDDDVELVELITDALVADGRFEVRIANNGFDAGMMVKEYHPDIIVLDVMLPDINGKEVCQRVRSDSALDDVRIICISGMVEQDKIQELKLSGANQFLQKPFEVDTLIDNICRLLDIEQLQS